MKSKHLTLDGVTLTLKEWSQRTGIRLGLIYARRHAGWSDRDILTRPRWKHSHNPPPVEPAAASALRRASELRRVPSWAELAEITEFYRACPEGHVVDHIVPLQGNAVSGLHVLANLQYLTPIANGIKGNGFE